MRNVQRFSWPIMFGRLTFTTLHSHMFDKTLQLLAYWIQFRYGAKKLDSLDVQKNYAVCFLLFLEHSSIRWRLFPGGDAQAHADEYW